MAWKKSYTCASACIQTYTQNRDMTLYSTAQQHTHTLTATHTQNQHDVTWHGTALHSTEQHMSTHTHMYKSSIMWHDMALHDTAQHIIFPQSHTHTHTQAREEDHESQCSYNMHTHSLNIFVLLPETQVCSNTFVFSYGFNGREEMLTCCSVLDGVAMAWCRMDRATSSPPLWRSTACRWGSEDRDSIHSPSASPPSPLDDTPRFLPQSSYSCLSLFYSFIFFLLFFTFANFLFFCLFSALWACPLSK